MPISGTTDDFMSLGVNQSFGGITKTGIKTEHMLIGAVSLVVIVVALSWGRKK